MFQQFDIIIIINVYLILYTKKKKSLLMENELLI